MTVWLALPVFGISHAGPQISSESGGSIQTEIGQLPSQSNRSDPARQDLEKFYRDGSYALVWVDGRGHPNDAAVAALGILRAVSTEGLDPLDYESADLNRRASLLRDSSPPTTNIAAFDVRMTLNVLRYLRQLHLGRVDPRALGFHLVVPVEEHDFPDLLRAAFSGQKLEATVTGLEPPLAQYRGLRAMLARYRSLASDEAVVSMFRKLSFVSTKPGEPRSDLCALQQWLVTLGDMAASTPQPGGTYEGALVEGVKSFQSRHGLVPDGIIGKQTLEELHVPLSWRVRQIELALERLRWLPDLEAGRFLAVNIPMFHLWAWDAARDGGKFAFDTGVIVGRAMNHKTPIFVADMQSIEFRPYWNVPASIVRDEILPALARDPSYLSREDMELTRHDGRILIRQRPGPNNALGLIKFVFPNEHDVYMHATPAQALFSRTRRDFSHGCIRLEDPVGLAEWAFKDQPEWTRARIVSAMQGSSTVRVDLPKPIPVVLYYVTAAVMPQDGTIRFAQDIYGHDRALDAALKHPHRNAK